MSPGLRGLNWHRVYISSLFTYELPRTVRTVKYYLPAVRRPEDIVVGGIAATLMPDYIRDRVPCTVIPGPLDRGNRLGLGTPAIGNLVPDYGVIDSCEYTYEPGDSYFARTTLGCVRNCKFCAVPHLEPTFRRLRRWRRQITDARSSFGDRQHLVILDNNVLAIDALDEIIGTIEAEGFAVGAKRNMRQRKVDFNQGIDARLVTRSIAKQLRRLNLAPIRLAFDQDGVEKAYRRAIKHLATAGFSKFTNYMLYNYQDTPASLYRRMRVNLALSREFDVSITGFPMRYIPISAVRRGYVGPNWPWRYLRGVQCVLLATHGMVSPNEEFFAAAFGASYEQFLEILSMPDEYIIHRERHKDQGARSWRRSFARLSKGTRAEFLTLLGELNRSRHRAALLAKHRSRFGRLLDHYYAGGRSRIR